MSPDDFERNVFVNCPFSPDYQEKLRAIVFVLIRLGFQPCIASQESDSGDPRIEKIKRLIRECRHGIHDLSLNVASRKGDPARMNMPYELGLDLGARWFGSPPLDRKRTLVLEEKKGSVRKALTDLDFGDHRSHCGSIDTLIRELRAHFYSFFTKERGLVSPDFPTHDDLWSDWVRFVSWLQQRPNGTLRSADELDQMEIPEFKDKVTEWLAAQ